MALKCLDLGSATGDHGRDCRAVWQMMTSALEVFTENILDVFNTETKLTGVIVCVIVVNHEMIRNWLSEFATGEVFDG
jgi:hypothetical protein